MTTPHRPSRRWLTLPSAAVLGLALAACAGDPAVQVTPAPTLAAPGTTASSEATTDAPDATDAPGTGAADPTQAAPDDDAHAGVLAAIALAESETGGVAFEVDDADGGTWEISVASGDDEIDVRVTGDGTAVTGTDREGSLDGEDRDGLAAATITISDAIQAAAAHGTGLIDDVDLDREGSGFAWEVTFTDDTEVYVDVATGDVIRVE